ncbi:MAG: hypothetical protein GY717_21315 [Rhodobacteraceae bacterium]|nr:hypothetical protein [Paracoccaceae bacterium]
MTQERRVPRRGDCLPTHDYSNGVEGFEYDWFAVRRKAPDKARSPLVFLARFLAVAAVLILLTFANLGAYDYGERMHKLLDAGGLDWVAGKVMSLGVLAEDALIAVVVWFS